MVSLFVNPEDTFEISFVVAASKTKPNILYADVNEEELKKQGGTDFGEVEKHTVSFRVPSYGDSTKILDKSVRLSGDEMTLSVAEIRQTRLITLIKSWTFKDSEGKPVPTQKENVQNLHPLIAAVITIQLDKALQDRGLL
jgi:hypothetical protein